MTERGKIIKENADGSGYVEIPVAVTVDNIDFGRTSGGGGNGSITLDELRQMEANFPLWPMPVAVGVDSDNGETGHLPLRRGPQLGFVESVRLVGDKLWARIRATAQLFGQIKAGMWRGFSMEAKRDFEHPTGMISGWSLSGGIFTNAPATPTRFAIGASTMNLSIAFEAPESPDAPREATQGAQAMDEKTISLASHEAKVQEVNQALTLKTEEARSLATRVDQITTELATIKAQNDQRGAELSTIKAERDALKVIGNQHEVTVKSMRSANDALNSKIVELSEKLAESESQSLAASVRDIVKEAVAAGVAPAIFDGHEPDPASWMKSKYASLDAFRELVAALRGVSKPIKSTTAKSGHEPGKEETKEGDIKLSAEEQKVFDRLNRGKVDFGTVESEEEARELFLASKKGN